MCRCGCSFMLVVFITEIDASKRQHEADKKAIDELVRERDILNKVRYINMHGNASLFKMMAYVHVHVVVRFVCVVYRTY